MFDTPEYTYRVFVTDRKRAIDLLVWFYDQPAGAENLIQEANNDAGLTAYPSGRWLMNCNPFQLAMLADNLNCWLMLFHREEEAKGKRPRITVARRHRSPRPVGGDYGDQGRASFQLCGSNSASRVMG